MSGQLINNFLKENNKQYDLIAIDFIDAIYLQDEKKIETLIKLIDNNLSKEGSLWLTCDNFLDVKYNNFIPFRLQKLFSKNLFFLKNIICWVSESSNNQSLNNYFKLILFFTKDQKKFLFNKDLVREKHIWKDVEWGKRKFRYNEKGKDPGNVWLPTEDDGKAKITKHCILNTKEKNDRIFNLSTSSKTKSLLFTYEKYFHKNLTDIVIYKKNELIKNRLKVNQSFTDKDLENKNFCHKIFFKNSLNISGLKKNSVKLIITSPPYWNLKNYNNAKQIGKGDSYENYLENLNIVWKKCIDVLSDSGSIWININTRNIKSKFYNIPSDIVDSLNELNLIHFETVIWHKSSGIPVNERNLSDRFEYILGFKKDDSKNINVYEQIDSDYLFSENKNNLNVWNMNRASGSIAKGVPHPAMYPIELPRRIIRRFSKVSDIILDPFLGSGSTIVAAILENRNSCGYELNKDYKKIISLQIEKAIKENKSTNNLKHKVSYLY